MHKNPDYHDWSKNVHSTLALHNACKLNVILWIYRRILCTRQRDTKTGKDSTDPQRLNVCGTQSFIMLYTYTFELYGVYFPLLNNMHFVFRPKKTKVLIQMLLIFDSWGPDRFGLTRKQKNNNNKKKCMARDIIYADIFLSNSILLSGNTVNNAGAAMSLVAHHQN